MDAKRGSKKRKAFNQDDAISRITVKDLRSRRVFSPAVIIDAPPEIAGIKTFGSCEDLKLVDLVPNLSEIVESCLRNNDQDSSDPTPTEEESCFQKVDGFGLLSEHLKSSKNGGIEKSDIGFDANPNLRAEEGNDEKGSDIDFDANPNFGEEFVQLTPLEADVNVNGGMGVRHVQGTPSDGGSGGDVIPANIVRRNNYTYRSKSVLNPCSRLKVFKTPGSVGYRRLLPYLMDIAKDNSLASRNGPSPKLEQEISIDSYTVDISSIEPRNVDYGNLPTVIVNPANPNSISSECITDECSSGVKLDKPSEHTSVENPILCAKEGNDGKGSDSDAAMVDRTDEDFGEECVQMTPPDPDVFDIPEVNVNGGSKEKRVLGMSSNGGSKLVLNPGSRLKVFKTPGSVSYRRLLPYLMDITKDNSYASRNGKSLKPEKGSEVKPTVPLFYSHSPEIFIDRSTIDISASESPNVVSGTLPSVILNSGNPNWTSSEPITEECSSEVKLVKPSTQTSDVDPNLCAKEGSDRKGSDSDGAISDPICDDFVEECAQMTPPDSHVFEKAEVNVNGRSSEEYVQGMLSDGGSGGVDKAFPAKIDQGNNSVYKSKLVFNPCSRLKVFKTPGSVSYKRLLPYLMAITKDNSFASRNGQSLKFEKDLEVRPTVQLLDYHNQEIVKDRYTEDTSPIKLRNVDYEILPNVILDRVNPNSTSSECITEESSPKVKLVISVKPSKLDLAHDNASSIHESDPLVMSSCSTDSVGRLQGEVSHHFPKDAEQDSQMSGLKFTTDGVSVDHGLSQLETNISLALPHAVLTKGILKRNPRGCRGLCTCLNCASFRLHAERAFEFSKNQMLDAEEVASELIKELTYLRSMLEKTADSSNDLAVIQANQVKEACKSASKAEELAKSRLSQMNYDLNNHCTMRCLQRPRVSFANYVEEKLIQK